MYVLFLGIIGFWNLTLYYQVILPNGEIYLKAHYMEIWILYYGG